MKVLWISLDDDDMSISECFLSCEPYTAEGNEEQGKGFETITLNEAYHKAIEEGYCEWGEDMRKEVFIREDRIRNQTEPLLSYEESLIAVAKEAKKQGAVKDGDTFEWQGIIRTLRQLPHHSENIFSLRNPDGQSSYITLDLNKG